MSDQDKLKYSAFDSQLIFLNALDMLCIAGYDGYFKVLNPSWTRTLGYSEEELLARPWIEFVHPDDREDTESIRSVLVDGQEVYQFENRYICRDGSVKWLSWNSYPDSDKEVMFGVARDVTKAKINEERVHVLAEQNALLLSELRHRVKNNLAVVSGLVELEAASATYPETKEALSKVVMRLQAMAGVYDCLSPEDDGGKIDVSSYLQKLTSAVYETYRRHGTLLSFSPPQTSVYMSSKSVVSLGFTVTELLTNAVKYAYPDVEKGEIRVTLNTHDRVCVLRVEDDGIGMPDGFDPRSGGGTGMMVVRALVEQMEGELIYKSSNGTTVVICVPIAAASDCDET